MNGCHPSIRSNLLPIHLLDKWISIDFGHSFERQKSETSDFGWERAQIEAPNL
jgi:hypothetical protein